MLKRGRRELNFGSQGWHWMSNDEIPGLYL
jgi:hypothetical protein